MASRLDALMEGPTALPHHQRAWGGAIFAAVLMILMLILPSGTDYLFGLASHAPGTAAASFIIILGLIHLFRIDRFLVIGFVTGVIVVSHLFLAAMFVPIAYSRAASSLLLLIFMLGAARTYGPWLFRLPDLDLARMTAIVRWFMVVVAVAAILGFAPPGGAPWEKPVSRSPSPRTSPWPSRRSWSTPACATRAGRRSAGW
jgi:hypothetical protein